MRAAAETAGSVWAELSGEAWGVVSARSDIGCCRFQSEPTKCLEYARDHDKASLGEPLASEAETEDTVRSVGTELDEDRVELRAGVRLLELDIIAVLPPCHDERGNIFLSRLSRGITMTCMNLLTIFLSVSVSVGGS